jgi:hypothetical protein
MLYGETHDVSISTGYVPIGTHFGFDNSSPSFKVSPPYSNFIFISIQWVMAWLIKSLISQATTHWVEISIESLTSQANSLSRDKYRIRIIGAMEVR